MADLDVLRLLKDGSRALSAKTVTLGFDGFIDSILRVVRNKSDGRTDFFQTVKQFGEYTLERSAGNFSLELQQVVKKPGGNMPIMALALARWAGRVNCIGALGYPALNPIFTEFPDNCTLFSFADPGVTTALEFNDGKIIMGEMTPLSNSDWNSVRDAVGLDTIVRVFNQSDLIAMVNWSELDHASDIWKGILTEVLPRLSYPTKPLAFFDLADCSRKSPGEIGTVLELIKSFPKWFDVTLGLNRNEATLVYKAMARKDVEADADMIKVGDSLYALLGIPTLIIHFHTTAIAWNKNGYGVAETTKIANPVLVTGAGDNFNAGYCAGVLLNLDLSACLSLGHLFAGHYMQHGKSISKAFTTKNSTHDRTNL